VLFRFYMLDLTSSRRREVSKSRQTDAKPFGYRAKQAMSALVFGKDIAVYPHTIDRYGRTVAVVYVDGLDAGLELLRQRTCLGVFQIFAGSAGRHLDTSRRHEVLSFNHHREVASLDMAEADSLLDWCEAPLRNGRKRGKTRPTSKRAITRRNWLRKKSTAGSGAIPKRRLLRGSIGTHTPEQVEAWARKATAEFIERMDETYACLSDEITGYEIALQAIQKELERLKSFSKPKS
jgi:Staphylococcal nuclease homologue